MSASLSQDTQIGLSLSGVVATAGGGYLIIYSHLFDPSVDRPTDRPTLLWV